MRRISLLHAPLFIMFVSLLAIAKWMTPPLSWPKQAFDFDNDRESRRLIIVITPTYRRPERLADITRLSQTLNHIQSLYWILIEDGNNTVAAVERIVTRARINHTYIAARTVTGFPSLYSMFQCSHLDIFAGRGWWQRAVGLNLLRVAYQQKTIMLDDDAVVYFADDDNTYDVRLFDDYIRNVDWVGVWAVGLVGGVPVESPMVVNGAVTGWNVDFAPKRKFAIDMAGFAVSLRLILASNATFGSSCPKGAGASETCFLDGLGISMRDLRPFGFDSNNNNSINNDDDGRELLVWHTKTTTMRIKKNSPKYGFFIEI